MAGDLGRLSCLVWMTFCSLRDKWWWCFRFCVLLCWTCRLLPSVLRIFEEFHRMYCLAFEPWGHIDHSGIECRCRSSDCMGAYVNAITFDHPGSINVVPTAGVLWSLSDEVPLVRPGSVPFMTEQAGAYGWLLLATHKRMMTGGLAACDWLTPVTRGGGGGRTAPISVVEQADVSWLGGADCWWCVSLGGSVGVCILTWTQVLVVQSVCVDCFVALSNRSIRFACVPVLGESICYCALGHGWFVRDIWRMQTAFDDMTPVGFHDVIIENLLNTPNYRSRMFLPGDITSLRRRWTCISIRLRWRHCAMPISGVW